MVEAKRPLKAQLSAEVQNAATDADATKIRAEFDAKEAALEHSIDHAPLELHCELEVSYKCAARRSNRRAHSPPPTAPSPPTHTHTSRVFSFLSK